LISGLVSGITSVLESSVRCSNRSTTFPFPWLCIITDEKKTLPGLPEILPAAQHPSQHRKLFSAFSQKKAQCLHI